MGQILLACRLAGRDLRHRPSQPLLLLVVLTAAMATLTLGLVLRGVNQRAVRPDQGGARAGAGRPVAEVLQSATR